MDRPFAELDTLYREVVLDHYRSPRGREALPDPDVQQDGFNPICGDEVHVAVDMDDGRIRSVQIKSRGCAISVASGSMLAEILPGMSRKEVEQLTEVFRKMIHGEDPPSDLEMGDLSALHGVAKFPVRVKCALLPWMTLKEALRAWDDGQSAPAHATSTEEQREEGSE